jgi:hypothetical protein
LKITPGVTLKFEHSIGMMIAGEIIAEGDLKGGNTYNTHFYSDNCIFDYVKLDKIC